MGPWSRDRKTRKTEFGILYPVLENPSPQRRSCLFAMSKRIGTPGFMTAKAFQMASIQRKVFRIMLRNSSAAKLSKTCTISGEETKARMALPCGAWPRRRGYPSPHTHTHMHVLLNRASSGRGPREYPARSLRPQDPKNTSETITNFRRVRVLYLPSTWASSRHGSRRAPQTRASLPPRLSTRCA